MSKPTLIYFAARGRAELIRLVAAEAGVEYQELHEFQALKGTDQLPFDAVPVWVEPGGLSLAQSAAIVNHLGRAHGLAGKNPRELALCEQALGGFDDVRGALRAVVVATPEARAAVRSELVSATLPRWFGHFDRLLAGNQGGTGFFIGDAITTADLAVYYLVEVCRDNGFHDVLAKFPRLTALAGRIGERPRVAAYAKSAARHPLVPLPT